MNRFEVVVLFRVLQGDEVASALGCSHPVRPLRSLNDGPFRHFFSHPSPMMRFIEPSSPEVRSFLSVCPGPSPSTSRSRAPLLGFCSPSTFMGSESPRPAGFAVRPSDTFAPDVRKRFPFACYGAAPRFSQPLSGFLLSLPSHHFQMGNALGVLPSGVCSFHEAPVARRHQHALLTFFPAVARLYPR